MLKISKEIGLKIDYSIEKLNFQLDYSDSSISINVAPASTCSPTS